MFSEEGKLMCWGWNEHGICGTGDENNVPLPTQVALPAKRITSIGCGAGHSFALVSRWHRVFFVIWMQLAVEEVIWKDKSASCYHIGFIPVPSFIVRWGFTDELRFSQLRILGLSNTPSWKPGVDQNIALCALSAAQNSAQNSGVPIIL